MKTYFIYKYTFPNGKVYIGQTFVGSNRYGESSQYRKQAVYNAMIKYPNYQKEILCYCCPALVDFMESYYIEKYQSNKKDHGYNCESGGNKNKHHSEETKKKISESIKGDNNPRYGKECSEETKRKISEANKGKLAWNKGLKEPKELTMRKYKPIICEEINKEYLGATEAAKELGLNRTHITSCCRGKLKTHGGYHFRYKEVS